MTAYRSKTTVALEAIRERILNGEVGRGERFDVRTLAAELGMSITPVREALRILQTDGLVAYDEHRAISAMTLSLEDARELYVLRSMLESYATELAGQRWTEDHQAKAVELHACMVEAADQNQIEAASRANRDWHFHIYRAAGTRFIEPMITRLWDQYAWNTIWSVPHRLTESVHDHELILEALQANDPVLAAERMRDHIGGGAEAVKAAASP